MIKICTKCKETKELDQFYKDNSRPDKRRCYCKSCANISFSKYRTKDPAKTKANQRKSKYKFTYKISMDEYNQLLTQQDSKCAICSRHQTELKYNLAVDHCHTTGKVRGLLCSNCNTGIGNLRDDPTLIQKALDYVINS